MKAANLEQTNEGNGADQNVQINLGTCLANRAESIKTDSVKNGTRGLDWLPSLVYTDNNTSGSATYSDGTKCQTDPFDSADSRKTSDTTSNTTDQTAESVPNEVNLLPQDEHQKQFLTYLQDSLGNLLPVVFDNQAGQTTASQKQLNELLDGMRKENKESRFGEKTQKAYELYVNWLQQTALPRTLDQLQAHGAEVPAGMPGKVVLNSNVEGGRVVDLELNTKQIPTLDNLKTLNAAFDWVKASHEKISTSENRVVEQLKNVIVTENHPAGWNEGADSDPDWAEKAVRHITLVLNVRDAVQAQMEFGKAARYHDFPNQLPPGAKLTEVTGPDGKKQYRLDLDLPRTLDESDPANIEKFNKNNLWLEAAVPRLKQVAEEGKQPPLIWGDIELHGMHARLGNDDQLIDFVDQKKHTRESNEWLVKANLIENRFDVKHNEKTGKIEVTPTVQAQYAFGYMNAVYDNVGEPKPMKMREYDPDDYVHIQVGNTSQLIKARDLESFKSERKFEHYGEKVATVAGDVAMLATGTIEVALVLRAAMIASKVAGAGTVATRSLVLPGLNAVSDVTLGASGFALNNAAARESTFGHVANEVRNYAFMGKAGQGLFRAVRPSGNSVIENLLQKSASGPVSQYAPSAYKWANVAGEVIGYGSLYPLHTAVSDHLRDVSQHKYDVENGKTLVDDINRRVQINESGTKPERLDVPPELISEYGKTLGRERPHNVQEMITIIFDETKRALGPESTEQQMQDLKSKLVQILSFLKREIKQLEIAQVGPLTSDDLSKLRDPNQRQAEHFTPATRALAERIWTQRDADIRRSVEIALLLVTARDNPTDQQTLASFKTTMPATVDYGPFISRNGRKVSTPVQFEQHELEQGISRDEIRRSLFRQFEQSIDPGRQLVLAHAMLATGIMTPSQYRSVIKGLERKAS